MKYHMLKTTIVICGLSVLLSIASEIPENLSKRTFIKGGIPHIQLHALIKKGVVITHDRLRRIVFNDTLYITGDNSSFKRAASYWEETYYEDIDFEKTKINHFKDGEFKFPIQINDDDFLTALVEHRVVDISRHPANIKWEPPKDFDEIFLTFVYDSVNVITFFEKCCKMSNIIKITIPSSFSSSGHMEKEPNSSPDNKSTEKSILWKYPDRLKLENDNYWRKSKLNPSPQRDDPPEGFNFVATDLSMSIYIRSAVLSSGLVIEGDWIGVFDENGTCCGAEQVPSNEWIPLGLTAWGDDEDSEEKDGFDINESISFKIWDSIHNNTVENIQVFVYKDQVENASPPPRGYELVFSNGSFCVLSIGSWPDPEIDIQFNNQWNFKPWYTLPNGPNDIINNNNIMGAWYLIALRGGRDIGKDNLGTGIWVIIAEESGLYWIQDHNTPNPNLGLTGSFYSEPILFIPCLVWNFYLLNAYEDKKPLTHLKEIPNG